MDSAKISLTAHPSGRTASVTSGTAYRDAARRIGLHLHMPCGAKGKCGKCKVLFHKGAPDPTPSELSALTESELAQGYRLGCQVVLDRDAVVYLRDHGRKPGDRILTTGVTRQVPLCPLITKRFAEVPEPTTEDLRSDVDRVLDSLDVARDESATGLAQVRRMGSVLRESEYKVTGVFAGTDLISLEAGDTTSDCCGVAFDIGTTTLAGYLLDLNTGAQLAVAAAVNPQTRVGEDVISRISHTMQEADGLRHLQSLVVTEMNRLVRKLARQANVSRDRVYEAVIVGNTCMTHLLLRVDPRHLAMAPYVPAFSRSVTLDAAAIGLGISRLGRAHVLPNIAGYVGADTVGAVLATAAHESDSTVLIVDIGTNGEIVLGSRERMLACSTAAGPAFEGAHIKQGMRAAPGAIDAVWMEDGDIRFSTVSNGRPVGICGSGLLDAVVCLRQAGILEEGGRIVDAGEVPPEFERLMGRLADGEFVLATAEESAHAIPVSITQRDIREVQLAKGAIAAGIRTLLERLSIRPEDLGAIVLAGAFGNYMRKESAIAAGLIPDVPLSKVRSVGNAAGEGAKLALISADERTVADRVASSVQYVELTTDPGFQERFADALTFGPWPENGLS